MFVGKDSEHVWQLSASSLLNVLRSHWFDAYFAVYSCCLSLSLSFEWKRCFRWVYFGLRPGDHIPWRQSSSLYVQKCTTYDDDQDAQRRPPMQGGCRSFSGIYGVYKHWRH